jgi:hypothetical protein
VTRKAARFAPRVNPKRHSSGGDVALPSNGLQAGLMDIERVSTADP